MMLSVPTASAGGCSLIQCHSVSCSALTKCIAPWFAAPGTNQTFVNMYARGLPACDPATYLLPTQSPPEKFWNCADIAIRRAGLTHRLQPIEIE